jgi:hypothetical protein
MDVGAKIVDQRLAMALGKPLYTHQRALVAENDEDRPRSIHHWGKRTPRLMRQSGRGLSKLIRSVAEAAFSS